MNLYLSGPMTNQPYFNWEAFAEAEERLLAHGFAVFNPARAQAEVYGEALYLTNPFGDPREARQRWGFNLRLALARDLKWLCQEADGLAMLPRWELSRGARAEHSVAVALHLPIAHLPPRGHQIPPSLLAMLRESPGPA